MTADDLAGVLQVQEGTTAVTWTTEQFLAEVGGDGRQVNVVLEIPDGGGGFLLAGFASAWVVAGEMQINHLLVQERRRRRGHGKAILDHLLEQARRFGCSEASLEVGCSNQAARRLYEAAGFRETGRRRGYYRNSADDALILTRDLSKPLGPAGGPGL